MDVMECRKRSSPLVLSFALRDYRVTVAYMKLSSSSFPRNGSIPERYAFCRIDAKSHIALADNVNPQLSWNDAPPGTQSFVLICSDPDVPSRRDDVNQEGRHVPDSLPRVDFYHWTLINLAPEVSAIEEGAFSSGVTARGKSGPDAPMGTRQGINNYTAWFAADADMNGNYFGYDGPCPPWNDARVHRYIFTLYALDVRTLDLQDAFRAEDVLEAIRDHVLAEASLIGTYTLNPALSAPTPPKAGLT